MPTLELVNRELINDSRHGSLSNEVTSRVTVNGLTASWTHVRMTASFTMCFNCNLQDNDKLVLNDISFTVDQVRHSVPSHSQCIT